jgi:hypothetical protein
MDDHETQNSKTGLIAAALVVMLVLGGGAWWYFHRAAPAKGTDTATDTPAATSVPVAKAPPIAPAIQHPLQPEVQEKPAPLPAVADSDGVVAAALSSVFGDAKVKEWLIGDGIVRRVVATVDNLPRDTHIERLRPVRVPAGPFVVQRETVDAAAGTERITLSEKNFSRYDAAVAILAATNTQQLVSVYRHIYPLFQRAYEDLGYPDGYFNDRVVEVIDHLLATPELTGPIRLVQPKVLYEFEDPELQARSAGQKLLLRMGPTNARVVKQKLHELRSIIAAKKARPLTEK